MLESLPASFGTSWRTAQNRWNLLIQRLTPNPWKTPPFTNSWENYGSGFAPAQYRQGPDGMVYLQGLVKRGVAGSNGTSIFKLPAGMIPNGQLLFVDGAKRVDVTPSGEVIYVGGESTVSYLSLSNVSFMPS